ncbi:L-lactate dehydrogenase, partial [Bifidobacteriaceae bacterium NR019]
MRKVAVIGMGNVGAAVAHQLVVGGYADELYLYDKNEAKVKADALDFEDSMDNLPFNVNITVNDYDALKDVEVIVSAMGNIKLLDVPNPDRFAELKHNRVQVEEVGAKIKASGFHGVLIDI